MRQKCIIVATPDAAMRQRLAALIDGEAEFRVILRTSDLMTTYTSVEETLPEAVLIADVLANLPEFEVMRGLFETLDIRWLVVTTPNRPSIAAELAWARSDLFAVPADAAPSMIVRQLKSLTRSTVSRSPAAPDPTMCAVAKAAPGVASPNLARPDGRPRPVEFPVTDGSPRRPARKAPEDSRVPRGPAEPADIARKPRWVPSPGTGRKAEQTVATPAQPVQPACEQGQGDRADPAARVILIGSSTGGVDALLTILSQFPARCPPTMIVQHTGLGFGESLAGLLDRQCRARVRLARGTTILRPGEIVIGAGMKSHLVLDDPAELRVALKEGPPVSGHAPSVDMLFRSAVPLGKRISAAILTGMGRDGAEGLLDLRTAGARTIAQDEASSVVWGMPRAAAEIGASETVLPLDRIGPALLSRDTLGATRRREAQT